MTRQIVTEVVADASKFKRGTDEAIGHAGRLKSGLGGISGGLVIGAGAAAFGALTNAIGAAAGMAQKSVKDASDLNETLSKTQVVFGNGAKAILDWSKTASTAMGMSRNEALSAASTYGNLFVSLGVTGKAAGQMSTGMVQLASDLASFNNADPSEVLLAIRSGLVGESEPLRKFGINLSDAALREQALAMGLTTSTKTVLPASIKAQAAYALMMKQSSTAQGDFARTSSGLANQQRISAAQSADLSATIGTKLLPVFIAFQSVIVTAILPAIETLSGMLGPIAEAIMPRLQAAMSALSTNIMPAISAAFAFLGTTVLPPLAAAFNLFLNEVWARLQVAFTWVSTVALPAVSAAFAWISDNVLPKLGIAFTTIAELITTSVIPPIIAELSRLATEIVPLVAAAFQWIGDNVIPKLAAAFEWVSKNILPGLSAAITWIATNIIPILRTAFGVLGDVARNVFGAIGTVVKAVQPIVTAVFTVLSAVVAAWVTALQTAFNVAATAVGVLQRVFKTMGDIVGGIFGAIGGVIRGAINAVIGAINGVIDAINSIQVHIHVGPVNYDFDGLRLGHIPRLHMGGIVPGPVGADVLTLLQAGERVTPAGAPAAPVIHITIAEGAYIDGPSIDRLTNLIAQRLRYAPGT